MKKLLVILTGTLLTLTSTAQARNPVHTVTLASKAIDLAINSKSAHFRVNYPGLGNRAVCSLELQVSPYNYVSSAGLNDLLVVEETFAHQVVPLKIVDSKSASIELERNLYVTQVSISTRDGRTLREALKDLGIYKGYLKLVGRGCQ